MHSLRLRTLTAEGRLLAGATHNSRRPPRPRPRRPAHPPPRRRRTRPRLARGRQRPASAACAKSSNTTPRRQVRGPKLVHPRVQKRGAAASPPAPETSARAGPEQRGRARRAFPARGHEGLPGTAPASRYAPRSHVQSFGRRELRGRLRAPTEPSATNGCEIILLKLIQKYPRCRRQPDGSASHARSSSTPPRPVSASATRRRPHAVLGRFPVKLAASKLSREALGASRTNATATEAACWVAANPDGLDAGGPLLRAK